MIVLEKICFFFEDIIWLLNKVLRGCITAFRIWFLAYVISNVVIASGSTKENLEMGYVFSNVTGLFYVILLGTFMLKLIVVCMLGKYTAYRDAIWKDSIGVISFEYFRKFYVEINKGWYLVDRITKEEMEFRLILQKAMSLFENLGNIIFPLMLIIIVIFSGFVVAGIASEQVFANWKSLLKLSEFDRYTADMDYIAFDCGIVHNALGDNAFSAAMLKASEENLPVCSCRTEKHSKVYVVKTPEYIEFFCEAREYLWKGCYCVRKLDRLRNRRLSNRSNRIGGVVLSTDPKNGNKKYKIRLKKDFMEKYIVDFVFSIKRCLIINKHLGIRCKNVATKDT